MLSAALGDAAARLVIEDRLEGEEASFHALVDGVHALPLVAAQDHKPVGEGDAGPNTGGMGAYSPTPRVDQAMADDIMARIVRPTVAAMAAEGRPFRGVLYCGLMLTDNGPKVIADRFCPVSHNPAIPPTSASGIFRMISKEFLNELKLLYKSTNTSNSVTGTTTASLLFASCCNRN